jgi:hypothetical protein
VEQAAEPWVAALEHERIPFVSYPYEWSFSMLRAATLLQRRIVELSLTEGMILKDASSCNVQLQGAHPVFIDVPSVVRGSIDGIPAADCSALISARDLPRKAGFHHELIEINVRKLRKLVWDLGSNTPLAEFIDWLATLKLDLVIEFVPKEDPMVETLLRKMDHRHDDYDQGFLEICLKKHFEIERSLPLESGTHTLYYGRRRS